MNPKKLKPLLADLQAQYPEGLASDVLDYYWTHVRKSIISIEYPKINIENLGIFQIRMKNLDKLIFKYKASLEYLDKNNFSKYAKYNTMLQRLSVLEKAKEEYLVERSRKIEIKTSRYENYITNLEREREDS